MDRLDNRSGRELNRYPYRPQRENPSFSSTLLDAIYRSIDEGGGGGEEEEEELVLYREHMTRKKRSNCTAGKGGGGVGGFEDTASLRRACMIEKWMEKKVSEKVVVRRKSTAEFERDSRSSVHHRRDSLFVKSSSSSSDSSSGGGFSSSETDSVYGRAPKPIRTGVSVPPEKSNKQELIKPKPKHENSFVKTKSKAMKIYGDLKKAKQPISPGGKLASFLNSLFTAGNTKKAKISSSSTVGAGGDYDATSSNSKSAYTSTCSSASSFSRSCLSKTPSSRGKLQSNNGMKRSVRFKDEPNSDLMANNNSIRNSIKEELKFHIMEKNRQVEEAARELLKNYHNKVQYERNDEDEDDDASCASSDLFELDNLSAIGIERYREELPVYETTHLDTNLAIANGLIS